MLNEHAIIVNSADNVAVVKKGIAAGFAVQLPAGREVRVNTPVSVGNRFAIRAIPAGDYVRQYGQPIGTSLGINEGDPISHANMSDDVPVVRTLPENLLTPPPDYLSVTDSGSFMGFRRPDGRTGTRNFVLIVPTSMCASHEAQQISMISEFTLWSKEKYPNVDGVVAISLYSASQSQLHADSNAFVRSSGSSIEATAT